MLRFDPRALLGDLGLDPLALLGDLGLEARPLLGQARVRGLGRSRLDSGELLAAGPRRALPLDLGQPFARAGQIPLRSLARARQLSLELLARFPDSLRSRSRAVSTSRWTRSRSSARSLSIRSRRARASASSARTSAASSADWAAPVSASASSSELMRDCTSSTQSASPRSSDSAVSSALTLVRVCSTWAWRRSWASGEPARSRRMPSTAVRTRLELPAQPLALRLPLLGLAAQPLALLARLVLVERAALLLSPSRRASSWACISSSARRASARPGCSPAPACSSSISRLLAASASARAAFGLGARLSQLRGGLLEGALDVLRAPRRRLDGLADLSPRPPGGALAGASPSGVGSGGGGSPSARNATIVPAARSSSSSCASPAQGGVDPVHDRAVALLQLRSALPRGAAISSASRKPLNSRLWLMLTGTSVRSTSSSCPSLRRAVVSTCAAAAGAALGRGAASPTSGRPSMRGAGPAEQLLGRAAPARDRAVSVGEHEAGIDELAQQLFDDLAARRVGVDGSSDTS